MSGTLTEVTGTVNVGNMGFPHVFALRSHGPESGAAVTFTHLVHPNIFIIEYIYLSVQSKPGDEIRLRITDAGFLVESSGLSFEATPVKDGFLVDKLVKIPIDKELHLTILRPNITAPDLNNPMTFNFVISGSLLTPQP